MASLIGSYSLSFGLFLSVFIIFFSVRNLRNTEILDKRIISFTFTQFFFVVLSFFGLIISFINSDFSNETVFNHSHTTKPLFYKISGTWGNHEGSLLLWLLVLTLFISIFLIKSSQQPKNYRILTLLFQQIIIIGFFIFLIKTSSPFNYIFPTPNEGLGLNPILQDPALAIHPPILYLGYVGSSIIFSSALAAMVTSHVSKEWAKHIKQWVLASWVFLTLGILLGSIWAYYELGWGGFWFWDPVENVSLMPWFALTTLLHCILVLEKKKILTSWAMILSIATFALSMSGTFLVRSGILNSVHTFANDPERGLFILIFLFTLIFLSIFIFIFFHSGKEKIENNFFWLSKETSILINNWFMMYFLSVVLIGTIYPIFLEVITANKISVGPPFYNKLILPFLIPFLIAMAIGPNLNWVKSDFKDKFYMMVFLTISFLLSALIIKQFDIKFLVNTILVTSAFFLFFSTSREFFVKRFKNLSQNIAHFGFSLLILSVLFNNIFSNEVITNLKIGETFKTEKFTINFENIDQEDEKNFKAIIGKFNIQYLDGSSDILNPELRIYNQPNIITSEADIKTNLFTDKFITMNYVQNQEYFNIRYQVKPFMIWIWISVLLITFGGSLSLFNKRYEI
ncbi:heme lyase CcmF/NrfE family subunit [Candidatus Pelagibacter sp. RS39]|uniref:heme lyase CcmF/NrfE family subunit n=1 Tax=Candidatus Pelagibacter sp. RS39 TaxID=1977864 RepID=UPI000A1514CE|nr:heme lyase CcmF/NrfE family subunit [Candidatus Pelagibacter sp. RS39]ARJ47233.1 cytochrome C biogenesis protein [Candidatus Pelagibacter sp. RS39]